MGLGVVIFARVGGGASLRWMMTDEEYQQLQRRADRICSLILISDYPEVDIVVERSLLRGEVADHHPEALDLYDQVFEARFERLWEQFRVPESELR